MTWMARLSLTFVAIVSTIAVAGCGDDDGNGEATPAATTAGSTPAGGEPTPAATETGSVDVPPVEERAYAATQVTPQADFGEMLEFQTIPGEPTQALVMVKNGVIYNIDLANDEAPAEIFLDVRDRMKPDLDREEGTLGLAFAPDYEESREFYVYYSKGDPRRTVLSRFTSDGATADRSSEQELLEIAQPFGNHNGGSLAFGPDGMLYIGVGDGGSGGDPQGNGQNTNTLLGTILRIDVSGSGDVFAIPADNPFAASGSPEIFAYGFRNPWRFSFDSETGDLWVGDVGQVTLEEIDLVEIGGNYGWNIMEGSRCYNAESCDTDGLILPRAEYTHEFGCSVTGGRVYRGDQMPELVGWYVYGDFCTGNVWAFDTTDLESEPVLIAQTGLPISSFGVDADGELLLVTFANQIAQLVRG